MTYKVSSFVAGRWHEAPEGGTVIADPTTGAAVAEVSSEGIDAAEVVRYGRDVGGPALRAMTFHERAGMLKQLAGYLTEHREAMYADYAITGQTQADAQVDIEGGIQVLGVYASIGRKQLPHDTIYSEAAATPVLRGPAFVGQTIYTTRPGVALLINAFNFPVWGALEKMAPTLLAGMPVIVKPATQTARAAEAMAKLIVESGILPDGAFQFVAGSGSALLDSIGMNDHLSITGSAATAAMLRRHAAVVERGATFNAEADSLNSLVIGPDADASSDEFDLAVKSVAREITSKTGQKCTAIRRVFVPEDRVQALLDALEIRLAKVVVGDPRSEETVMGPLVSAQQRADVETAVRSLMTAARPVIGGPDATPTVDGAGDEHGFFAPTVLLAEDPQADALHEIEAFGPVTTVIPYTDLDEAAHLVGRGGGSLVASVHSNDPQVVREVVRAIAPFHGRVLVVNRDIARGATPHGAVVPTLIHGGPGRAGGGEELGGLRGVLHLMQATSVASSADMNVALTDRWNAGAQQLTPDVHPFRLHLEDLRLGDTLRTKSRVVTLEDIEHFAHFTGDTFYAHMDEEAAAASPLFNGRVAHGYFILAAAAGLFVDPDPGPVLANFGLEHLRFVQPVYPGDEISLRLTAKHKAMRPGAGWGEVTWDVEVRNDKDEIVATYDLLTINASKEA